MDGAHPSLELERGRLYRTDERGLITSANLIVATQNNAARIAMSVDKAARWVNRSVRWQTNSSFFGNWR